jgi:hypothetical protein
VALTAPENLNNQPWRKENIMQMISYMSGGGAASGSGPKAVAPVVNQAPLTIAVGAGAAYQDLLAEIAAGTCAADAGQISNKGCLPLRVKLTYIDGGADCDGDGCPDDGAAGLTTVDIEVDVPANSSFPLPAGLVSQIQVATIDELGGALFANTAEQKLFWYSAYQPAGCACVAVPA